MEGRLKGKSVQAKRKGIPLDLFLGFLIYLFFVFLGMILIVGTWWRWPWLVDPPLDQWTFNFHAFIKKFFGQKFLIYFNYVVGAIIIIVLLIYPFFESIITNFLSNNK
jgi:hypothetical protein